MKNDGFELANKVSLRTRHPGAGRDLVPLAVQEQDSVLTIFAYKNTRHGMTTA